MRRNVLLLQGPIGPFFSRLAEDLEQRGFNVIKVNFNGGDRFFHRSKNAIDYTGSLETWEAWLERLITNKKIGRIYLFGDCRAYHRIAREVAARQPVRLFVFEEGYIRPNFITLEEDGVNGHSPMMDDPVALTKPARPLPEEITQPKHVFLITACYSMLYYWASAWRGSRFEHYRHHRPFEWLSEGARWIRSGYRKLRYARRERKVLSDLLPQFDGNYFVCPLQVHCDMQVIVHSEFNSIEHFVGDVLASFSKHAPSNKAIVFKHHPLDRGYTDYTCLFANLIAELGLQDRVFYVHDTCLPTLLKHAQGTVLINSTVGVSSLFHGTPVKCLGDAIYDLPGLTEQQSLDDFWEVDGRVDPAVFQNFRSHLVLRNQLNGNLYRRLSKQGSAGIVWSGQLEEDHTFLVDRVEPAIAPQLTVIAGGMSSKVVKRGDDAEAA
ncbi:MAG: capsular biosynthesis protein [Granulosicoccus sp.]